MTPVLGDVVEKAILSRNKQSHYDTKRDKENLGVAICHSGPVVIKIVCWEDQ